jgi:hypothetical protein
VRALLIIVLTGCWTASQPAAPEPQLSPEPPAPSSTFRPRRVVDACDRTIADLADKLRPQLGNSGLSEETIAELSDAARESCRETEWSAELLACYDHIADASEISKCQDLMTQEQNDDLSRRMMDVISRSSSLPPPPPPPAP